MTSITPLRKPTTAFVDDESDYGSGIDESAIIAAVADDGSDYGDFDEASALRVLSTVESQPLNEVVLESIEDPVISNEVFEKTAELRIPDLQSSLYTIDEFGNKIGTIHIPSERSPYRQREASVEVEYDLRNRKAFSPSNREERTSRDESLQPEQQNTRPPLERFRKNRPLSVTDLVSPAWCELQYEFNLSKYGRVRKTPAMKQGTTVHKELEDQVHIQVPVEIETAEDRFALRIWNSIQGLRSLRETGVTRELEVWGVLEGEVVIGIIDEITTKCPDETMEAQLLEEAKMGGKGGRGSKNGQPSADQRTLTDFLTSSQNGSILEKNPAFLGTLQERPPTYYLIDVKTRQSKTLPAPGAQSRPTHMQLMAYHLLISSMAANKVPADRIFQRYKLRPYATFSDKFIAQIASLDVSSFPSVNDEDISPKTTQVQREDSLAELLEHNNLAALWTLLSSEFALTFPIKLSQSPISPMLTAEFRTGRPIYADHDNNEVIEAAGSLIGRRCFDLNPRKIGTYVQDEMRWWKGQRETKGVDIEEAFKCRICEFAEGCEWRKTKVDENLRKAKLRAEARRRSEV